MKQIKIMLVDDEEHMLSALRRSLKRDGYELVTFTAAEPALEYLEQNPVDIVISDHRMPGMTGIDFLIQVRKLHPEIVRILLTGYADMEVAIRAVNEGKLYRFLTKPWNDDELKSVLQSAVNFRRFVGRNREAVIELKIQHDHLRALETFNPGITEVVRDASGAIIIDEA